jgi:glycosyltransferase involved in cell wall biosynthesis
VFPVLIVSDAASGQTGLGRIARQIAVRANEHLKDVCRVATMGSGGPGSRKLNFQQYAAEGMEGDFVMPNLPDVWDDWAGEEKGIILFIWDASRLGWIAHPEVMCEAPSLRAFLAARKFKKWIYAPIDAEGPNRKLTYPISQNISGFDRVLTYSGWAEGVVRRTLGAQVSEKVDLSSIPHGIDSSVFYPRGHAKSRAAFGQITGANYIQGTTVTPWGDEPLIGTVATNQARKDWGLWAESCALFLKVHPNARFWIHTDKLERDWSIPALLVDFGLLHKTVISLGYLEDDRMAQAYSACDLTLGIGAGEGFGYPIFESLFCGTNCIHGNYGGAPAHMDKHLLVDPIGYHYKGVFTCKRPVFNAQDWADKMVALFDSKAPLSDFPEYLDWQYVWPRFEVWIRKGLVA